MVTKKSRATISPSPWISFALLQRHWEWELPKNLALPFEFAQGITYQEIPLWLFKDDGVDELRKVARDGRTASSGTGCIAVEYLALADGSPDPDWKGKSPRSMQDRATEKLFHLNLALWLAIPCGVCFEQVVHAQNGEGQKIVRKLVDYEPILGRQELEAQPMTLADFELARTLFGAIESVSIDGTLRTAVEYTLRAISGNEWVLRFLTFWLVLEGLFGVEDGREVSYRLSQRIAFFLSNDRHAAKELFETVKESYSWRSKVVHGVRLAKLTPEKSETLLIALDRLIRQSLNAILLNKDVLSKFESKQRDEYLDSLIFA